MSDTSREDFQPIHNPYIVGNPIKDRKMFFGREDDFNYIKQKVTGGKKGGLLVLCGSRRSGKTSILFQIMNERLGEEFLPVLIDMQAMTVENDLDFLIKLAKGIIDTIGDDEISLERHFLAKRSEGSLAAFDSLIDKINERLDGKKLILLFDEYEIFESHIAKNLISTEVLHLFANWIEHREGVFIVFTGSDKIEERTAEYWSHFLGKALHRRISFLSKADALRLVEEPVRDVVRYEDGLPERIYTLTAGQPFYTQVFCQALVDHLNEVQEYDLTTRDLQAVIDQIIENPLPQMIFSWNSLSHAEKVTLSIIGELNKESVQPVTAKDILAFAKEEGIGIRIDQNALNETLEKLFHHDMLNKHRVQDAYTFKMDLWRRWMARMHSIWQVIDEVKSGEGELSEGFEWGERRRRKPVLIFGAAALVIVSAAIANWWPSRTRNPVVPVTTVDSTRLTIHTAPDNADVFLGQQRIGKSPIDGQVVAAVTAPLRIERAGYRDYVDTLTLRKGEPLERSITLEEKTGHVKLATSPTGARVYLDGARTEYTTPVTIKNLSVNSSYDIRLTLAGFNTREFPSVQIYEDSTLDIRHDFSRSTSQIQIISEPVEGASITLDGQLLGQTPSFYPLTHGSHRLVLEKDGYETSEQQIRIPAAGNTIRVVLNKLPPGTLVITVNPWANIFINGEMKKEQAVRYESPPLEPGTYTVELRNPHYESVTEVIRITSSGRTERNYNLTTKRNQ
jgi:hypothetical protein